MYISTERIFSTVNYQLQQKRVQTLKGNMALLVLVYENWCMTDCAVFFALIQCLDSRGRLPEPDSSEKRNLVPRRLPRKPLVLTSSKKIEYSLTRLT